jgi:WD40 repeat protein
VSNVTQTVVLRGHTSEINALDFSADSLRIVSASEDGTARVWDVATGDELMKYTHHADSSVAVVSAAFSPDGAWLALGFADGAIQMIPTAGGAAVVAQEVGTPIRALAFNPIGDVLASGSEDGNVTLWDMTNAQGDAARRENVGTLDRGVRGLTFSADGAFVFVVGADNTLRVFAVSQG